MTLAADIFIIDSEDKIDRLETYYDKLQPELFVLDVETNSKIEKLANLYGIGFCFNKHKAFYIIWKNPDGTNYWNSQQEQRIKNFIVKCSKQCKLIGHNIIYDVLVLENTTNLFLADHVYSDTILMKHSLNEEPPFALKELAVKELGSWADNAQDDLKEAVLAAGGKWNKEDKDMYLAPSAILGKYCCWDVLLTLELFNIYQQRLEKENLLDLFYKEEIMDLYREVTIPMKRRGIRIDVDHFKKLQTNIVDDIKVLEDNIQTKIEKDVEQFTNELLNAEAPVKNKGNFPKKLAEILNVPLPMSKSGKVTLAAKALEKQAAQSPQHLQFYNWLRKDFGLDINACLNYNNLEESIVKAQKELFFAKKPNANKRYVFNLASNDHLAHLLFKVYKLPVDPKKRTEGGKPQVSVEVLESYGNSIDILEDLLALKKLNKLKGTYIEGILDRQINGRIYASMLQFGTTSGRYASRNPNCLSMDTEILTDNGWKTYNTVKKEDKVACFSPKDESVKFHNPLKIWKSENKKHNIVNVSNTHMNILMTENHRCLFKNRKTNEYSVKTAKNFLKDSKLLHGGIYDNDQDYGVYKYFLQLAVAVQADAELREDNKKRIRFKFTKKRKYERLLYLLSNTSFEYEIKNKKDNKYAVVIHDHNEYFYSLLGIEKTFPASWITFPKYLKECLINELFYWDGSYTRKDNYSSNNESNVDTVQAMAALVGWRAHKREYWGNKSKNPNFQLDFTFRDYSLTANSIKETNTIECEVWCVEVPTSFFIARRKSDTFITGNCQNLPRVPEKKPEELSIVERYTSAIRRGFIADENSMLIDADYSALEPRAFSHMSGDKKLQELWHKGEDMYSRIAIDVFDLKNVSADPRDKNYLKKVDPSFRQMAKVFCLAVVYGAEEGRIAQSMGIDWKKAHEIITKYLKKFPGLRKYMYNSDYKAKTRGYVKTIFGRVRHLKEASLIYTVHDDDILDYKWAKKHNLLPDRRKYKNCLNNAKNFPIQGLAAHIVNRAMIAIAKEFKKQGLKSYQCLQVHDQIIVNSPKNEIDIAKKIVQDCMENTTNLSVPLIAEPEVANNMADSH